METIKVAGKQTKCLILYPLHLHFFFYLISFHINTNTHLEQIRISPPIPLFPLLSIRNTHMTPFSDFSVLWLHTKLIRTHALLINLHCLFISFHSS